MAFSRESPALPLKGAENDETVVRKSESSNSNRSKAGELDDTTHLLYFASQGDIAGIREVLAPGVNINGADYDGRTALHLAASEGQLAAVKLLLARGADPNPRDRWGSTPLGDAIRYGFSDICKALEQKGGTASEESKRQIRVSSPLISTSIPEYEIDPKELDFSKANIIGKGAFGEIRVVNWRGTRVAVKTILASLSQQPKIEKEFREELTILQKLRHPNIVQFLGAVTMSQPHMLVTEYLHRGDLHEIIRRKGPLSATEAIGFAMDIARGMSYLHQNKPDAVVHRDLKPRNLLRDEAGHLKVADFGLSRLLLRNTGGSLKEAYNMTGETGSYRYMAPEVFRHEAYDKSVDVYSFGIIFHEMFEGGQSFKNNEPEDVAESYAYRNVRPPFRALTYPQGIKELIQECWHEDPQKRPSFQKILERLENQEHLYNFSDSPHDKSSDGCQCTII